MKSIEIGAPAKEHLLSAEDNYVHENIGGN